MFFSYAQSQRKTKTGDRQPKRRRFVPDFQDTERLLPRLRQSPRRAGRL